MRNIVLITLAGLLLWACSTKSNKELLCKKWQIDVEAFVASDAIKGQWGKMSDQEKQIGRKQIEQTYYQFNPDGTCEISLQGTEKISGTWAFADEEKSLAITINEEKKTFDILDLSEDNLLIANQNDTLNGAVIETPMVPFK